ncbi:serine hydrolase [Alteromonas sp. C1M14]|uniref:serine hydrolase domain-containing protein n=1 Tax=Alteromonas sp. C1M14 TaxID=2841567 RepID=UPI001C090B89|nr:serine hydrolase [Alteromonas sp. C1M14]MBU2980012.1 beta-lactamase family protein [Alteromonas sp. C1M14]
MFAKIMKFIGLALAFIIVVIGIYVAFNFTYLKRTFTGLSSEQVRSIEWYEPKVEMSPATHFVPLNDIDDNIATTFPDAFNYAEKTHSSALLVWQKGKLIGEHYWQPYGPKNYTQTQSVHKSVLNLLVGIALDEGAISDIHDPVEKYIGRWIDQPYGTITIENLLTMSSGLGKEPAKFFLERHFLRLLNDPDITSVAHSLPQKEAPGQTFEYLNNNPQLLLEVLEAATGQPYETYMQDKLWSRVAQSPGYLWLDNEDGVPHGYCCMMAVPRDLLRLGILILQKGKVGDEQVVPAEWIAKSTTPSALNPNYGYLTWLGSPPTTKRIYSQSNPFTAYHSSPYVVDDIVYFDGFGGQRVYIIPSLELVIVRVGETTMDFDDALLPNHIITRLNTTISAVNHKE